jgi:hypothetical protein
MIYVSSQIGNIFFVDTFLGGAFLTYGTDVLKFSSMNQEERTDPMIEVFPRVTKCTFHKFGASGTIQKLDALCVLALNILNEKIYIFLWFWLIVLAIFSGLAVLYSMAVVLMPSTRETIIRKRFKFGTAAAVSALIRKTQVKILVRSFDNPTISIFEYKYSDVNVFKRESSFLESTKTSRSIPRIICNYCFSLITKISMKCSFNGKSFTGAIIVPVIAAISSRA